MATHESSLWRAMPLVEREREYSPSSCIGGNYQPFIAAYKTQSSDARAHCQRLGATWHHPVNAFRQSVSERINERGERGAARPVFRLPDTP